MMNTILSIMSGLIVCIPLIVELVKYINKAIQEKNWASVMQIVLKLMTEAEKNYATGAERKQYVLDSIKSIENTLNYEVNIDAISEMIDSICEASKVVNGK